MSENEIKRAVELINQQFSVEDLAMIDVELQEIPENSWKANLVAIDGSYLPLFNAHDYTAYLFRVSVVKTVENHFEYSSSESVHVISPGGVLDQSDAMLAEIFRFSRNEKNQISNLMELEERKVLLDLARDSEQEILFLIDGSLYYEKYASLLSSIIKDLKNLSGSLLSFIAISKSSNLRTIDGIHLDSEILDSRFEGESGFYETNVNWNVGKIYFAKLHPQANFYRMDVISSKFPSELFGSIGDVDFPLWLGYPLILIEAHRTAKLVRDLKAFYVSGIELPFSKQEYTLPKDSGELKTIHDRLDEMTRFRRGKMKNE